MSTPALIAFVDEHADARVLRKPVVYLHYDGYPSAVLPPLVELVRDFYKVRGNDMEYLTAQVLYKFMRESDGYRDELLQKHGLTPLVRFTGFGIIDGWNNEADWVYVVRQGGFVEVHRGATPDSMHIANIYCPHHEERTEPEFWDYLERNV